MSQLYKHRLVSPDEWESSVLAYVNILDVSNFDSLVNEITSLLAQYTFPGTKFEIVFVAFLPLPPNPSVLQSIFYCLVASPYQYPWSTSNSVFSNKSIIYPPSLPNLLCL